MKKAKPAKQSAMQEEDVDLDFQPTRRTTNPHAIRTLFFFQFIITLLGFTSAIVIMWLVEDLPADKQLYWEYIQYACILVPMSVLFFDTLNIWFPTGDAYYQILADNLADYDKMKPIKFTCKCTMLALILCSIDFFWHFGFSERSLGIAVAIIAVSWFLTGIVRFIRFC